MTRSASHEASGYISFSSIDGFELRNNIGAKSIRPDQGSGDWNVTPVWDRTILSQVPGCPARTAAATGQLKISSKS
jgi:hypothetical protein